MLVRRRRLRRYGCKTDCYWEMVGYAFTLPSTTTATYRPLSRNCITSIGFADACQVSRKYGSSALAVVMVALDDRSRRMCCRLVPCLAARSRATRSASLSRSLRSGRVQIAVCVPAIVQRSDLVRSSDNRFPLPTVISPAGSRALQVLILGDAALHRFPGKCQSGRRWL